MNIIRIAAFLALSAGAALSHQSAVAKPPGTTTVPVKDLDLSTAEGVRVARERLLNASRRMCSQVDDHLDLGRLEHYRACVDATLAVALRQLPTDAVVARRE